jgi:hypothetical protein
VSHPTLFSSLPVYLRRDHIVRMGDIIRAVEAVIKTPFYEDAALADAPDIARHRPGAVGVFMGYDFHLGQDGPKLIEINTNAGGALVNAVLAQAQRACCPPVFDAILGDTPALGDVEGGFVASFLSEWRRERGASPLKTIAIVDEDPEQQYLYPEFVLFQRLFQRHGLEAVIARPEELKHAGGRVWQGARTIDLVYNRLTDFYLEKATSAALRTAYVAGDLVVTPNPWAHARFAHKRNLVRLSDPLLLQRWGVGDEAAALLAAGIPKTRAVTKERAEELWAERGRLFFKPASGYGSKAAYRGDKITRRVWESILAGGYVAQEIVAPSSRTVVVDGQRQALKVDIRNYTYDASVQLVAARLYQGQTTNMRTPGGGFAPVLGVRAAEALECCGAGAKAGANGLVGACCKKETPPGPAEDDGEGGAATRPGR